MRILWLGQYYPAYPATAANAWTYLALTELSKRHSLCFYPMHAMPAETEKFLSERHIKQLRPSECAAHAGTDCHNRSGLKKEAIKSLKQKLPQQLQTSLTKRLASWATDRRIAEHVRALRQLPDFPFDVVHCDDIQFAPVLAACPEEVVKTMTVHNILSNADAKQSRLSKNPLEKLVLQQEMRMRRRAERAAVHCADLCFAMSEQEKRWIEEAGGNALVAPVGIDCQYFRADVASLQLPDGGPWLIYTGYIGFPPHADAIHYFVDEILPVVRNRWPEVGLLVVGKDPPESIRALSSQRLIVTGEVPDVRPYLHAADIAIVPMRFGSGVRIKIMEALCLGKPVVASTVGAEGLGLVPGKHFMLADDAGAFCTAVQSLLSNEELRDGIATEGRAFVEEHFDYRRVLSTMESQWQSLLDARGAEKIRTVHE